MEPMHWQPARLKEKGHRYAHNRSSTHTEKFADNAHSSIAVSAQDAPQDKKCWCWQCTNTAWFYYWYAASDGENVVEPFEQKKCFQIGGNQLEVMRHCYKELTKKELTKDNAPKDVAAMGTAELRSELAIASKLLNRENFLGEEESELAELLQYVDIDYEDDIDRKGDIHRISDAKFAKKVCLYTPYSLAPLIPIRSLACCRQLLCSKVLSAFSGGGTNESSWLFQRWRARTI